MSSRRKGNKSRQQRGGGPPKGIPIKPEAVDKPTRKAIVKSESSSDSNGRDLRQTTSQADHCKSTAVCHKPLCNSSSADLIYVGIS